MKVVLQNLTKIFPNRKKGGDDVVAVNDFSFEIPDGKLVGLLGPSGCGKSTSLYMICGLQKPTSGKIFFGDIDVTALEPESRGVGLVFQNYALYPHMTVKQNILYPLQNLKGSDKMTKEQMLERAVEVAKIVQIDELLERKPHELSGGQQQRVAIARALAKMPRVLLLDEPLSNLDARLRLQTREEIRRIQRKTGITTVFVTHDQEEAMAISDHIVLMKDGVMQQYDKPQDLYDSPANQFVADFLGNPPINNLPGTVKNGEFVTEDGSVYARLSILDGIPSGKKINLSVRSESFVPMPDGAPDTVPCVCTGVYTMGKDETASFTLGGTPFHAYIDQEQGLKEGQTIRLGFKKRGVFVFDRESGVRLK